MESHGTRFIDRTGQIFGRLTVLRYFGKNKHGQILWVCKCDCGGPEIIATGSDLHSGDKRSCGCLRREISSKKAATHGMARNDETSAECNVWSRMKARCYNPKTSNYANYGGRGIKVCDRWRDSFINFISDMGARPSPNHSIDRIDNDGDYCPENCRWATLSEQNSNTRRNRFIEFNGQKKTLSQWGNETGLGMLNIWNRLKLGWSVERALTEPLHSQKKLTQLCLFV